MSDMAVLALFMMPEFLCVVIVWLVLRWIWRQYRWFKETNAEIERQNQLVAQIKERERRLEPGSIWSRMS